MPSEPVRLDGHIIDSLTLSKVLDLILREGGDYRITQFNMGATRTDPSHADIVVSAPDTQTLELILHIIQQHGAARQSADVQGLAAPADGVLPDGFYATTNLETQVRVDGRWLPVENIEMDCGVVVDRRGGAPVARCVPMHQVRADEWVVIG